MQQNTPQDSLYEVQQIIGKTRVKNKVMYKVKWKGYPLEQSTWEKQSHLRYVKQLIEQFQAKFEEGCNPDVQAQAENQEQKAGRLELKPPQNQSEGQQLSMTKRPQGNYSHQPHEHIDIYLQNRQYQMYSKLIDNVIAPAEKTKPQNQTFIERDSVTEKDGKRTLINSIEKPQCDELNEGSAEKSQKQTQQLLVSPKSLKHIKLITSRSQSKKTKKENKIARKLVKDSEYSIKAQPETQLLKEVDNECRGDKKSEKDNKNAAEEISTMLLNHQKEQTDIKIRFLGDEPSKTSNCKDFHDYLICYSSGQLKVMNTLELMMTHPLQFVAYLEKKALAK